MTIAPLMGVCSSALQYDITDDGRVTGIRFAGGCPGNLEAVARLAEGLPAEAVISRLEGIQCPRPALISSPAPSSVSLPRAGRNEERSGGGEKGTFLKVPFSPPLIPLNFSPLLNP